MYRTLPDELKRRTTSEKIVWLYVNAYPGRHSVRSLENALGITAGRALKQLVKDGLLIEEIPPTGIRGAMYHAGKPWKEPKEVTP